MVRPHERHRTKSTNTLVPQTDSEQVTNRARFCVIWVPHYQPAASFQCHIINQEDHFSATLSTSSIISVSPYQAAVSFQCHYQPLVSFPCDIINQPYYFSTKLSTSSIISVSHYQPAVSFRATLSTSSIISVPYYQPLPHYQPAILFQYHIINPLCATVLRSSSIDRISRTWGYRMNFCSWLLMPLKTLIFVAVGTWRQHRDAVLLVSRSLHLTWSDLLGREHMSVLMCPFTT